MSLDEPIPPTNCHNCNAPLTSADEDGVCQGCVTLDYEEARAEYLASRWSEPSHVED